MKDSTLSKARLELLNSENSLNNLPLLSTAEDLHDGLLTPLAAGMDTPLSREDEDDFFELQIVKHHDSKVQGLKKS